MAKRLLLIDRDEQGHFFLSLDGEMRVIGGSRQQAEVVLRDLHISAIHCEVEVDDDLIVVHSGKSLAGKAPAEQPLHPGETVRVGHCQLRLEGPPAAPVSAAPAVEPAASEPVDLPSFDAAEEIQLADESPAGVAKARKPKPPSVPAPASAPPGMRFVKRLVVVDGGDQGRFYLLPDSGITTIGKSAKHADIVLHDLYVARIHCEIQVQGNTIRVTHVEGQNGTLIDGQRITEAELP